MKSILLKKLLLLMLVFMAGTVIAQPPPALPIQAVAKDALGNPAKNRKVYLRLKILHQSITPASNGSNIVWDEAFETTTNEDGVYSVIIGLGNRMGGTVPSGGNIGNIDWGNGPYYSNWKQAVAPSIPAAWWVAADNYIDLGTQQMMSVPYAMFAGNASVTNVSTSLPPGQNNTFLVTDSAGNVKWERPQAANVSVTTVTNLNLALNLSSTIGQSITIGPNTTAIVTVQVPGVTLGDPILVTPQGDYQDWSIYSSWVSKDGEVRIRIANFTDAAVDVKASEYKIVVIK